MGPCTLFVWLCASCKLVRGTKAAGVSLEPIVCAGYQVTGDNQSHHPINKVLDSFFTWWPQRLTHVASVVVDANVASRELAIRHPGCKASKENQLKSGWSACSRCWHAGLVLCRALEKAMNRLGGLELMTAYNNQDDDAAAEVTS